MRTLVSRSRSRCLAQVALICLAGTMFAGCSSDFTRFDRDLVAALPKGTSNQASSQAVNPYPGDVDDTTTASIGGAPNPVADVSTPRVAPDHGGLPAAGQAQLPPASAPRYEPSAVARADLPKPTVSSNNLPDPVRTASVPQARAIEAPARMTTAAASTATETTRNTVGTASNGVGGWTKAGGTAITLRDGETLYNLSKRYGVPVNEIMKANDIANADAIQSGQQIVIPTYVYSRSAPVSAPDNDKRTQSASASTGGATQPKPIQQAALGTPPQEEEESKRSKPKHRAINTDTEDNPPDYSVVTGSVNSTTGGYKVVSGDTLSGIASRHGVGIEALRQANGITGSAIRVGQVLTIPSSNMQQASVEQPPAGVDPIVTGSSKPASAESVPGPKPYVKPRTEDSIITGSVDTKAPERTGIESFRWPVNGRVISGFGAKKGSEVNDGIDISVPEGTAVKAAENGVVIYSGSELQGFGNLVLIRHADGYVTAYAHNKSNEVAKGDQVRRGQVIARSGRTGNASSPMLHFELRKDSKPVNPLEYLGG